jgi:hypothetical protein
MVYHGLLNKNDIAPAPKKGRKRLLGGAIEWVGFARPQHRQLDFRRRTAALNILPWIGPVHDRLTLADSENFSRSR